MLELKNVTKSYGSRDLLFQALKGVSLTVDKGEFVGIMGPSGSGKSTLLNLIGTIDKTTTGQVLLDGENPSELNQDDLAKFRRNELGFVFQGFNLMPTLTVGENIVLPLTLDGENVELMTNALNDMAQILGIEKLLDKRISQISGGQAQRVAIARAMIHEPKLLLADEPTGNLDTNASKEVMRLLSNLNQRLHSTILMVTHDAFAASYCQKIMFIKDGELIQEIQRHASQSEFYDDILVCLKQLDGEADDF